MADVGRIVPGSVPFEPLGAKTVEAPKNTSFADTLRDAIGEMQTVQHDADRAIADLATGGPASLHETILAVEKADLSFRLMMQVRNKIVEAYQEVLRMQV